MVVLAAAGLVLIPGCESSETASREYELSSYRADREPRRSGASRTGSGRSGEPSGERARYMAGANAHRRGRLDEAVRLLGPLTGSRDERIAGQANATLGLIHAARSDYAQATLSFRRAIRTLTGEDLAQAYYHLALAEQKLGRERPAQTHFRMAMNKSRSASFQRAVRQRMGVDGYALQVGAFSERANAEELARGIRSEAASKGWGPPRIVPSTTSSGNRLYLVRMGRFENFQTALDARRRLDRIDAIITPTDQ